MLPHQQARVEALTKALEVWPEFGPAAQAWLERVNELPAGAVDEIHGADLLLAQAALLGHSVGLSELHQRIQRLKPVALSIEASDAFAEEVLSLVGHRVFDPQTSRLGRYTGRGTLEAWLKVSVLNTALTLKRTSLREAPTDDATILQRADLHDLPEAELQKAEIRELFNRTLAVAMEQLGRRERRLLRQHYLDGLSLDNLAEYHGVHRATVARWLAAARQNLLEAFEHSSSESGKDLFAMVKSRLTLNVAKLLESRET